MPKPNNTLRNFRPISQSISKQIADKIQQMVMDEELVSGERLPAERKLAADLGVSRNVIREAIVILEERGIVSVNIGSGTFIAEPRVTAVSRSVGLYVQRKQITVAQIFEVRWALEVENARRAATNVTDKQLAKLADTIQTMKSNVDDLEVFTNVDIRFHQLLAESTQNPLLGLYLDAVQDLLQKQATLATALPTAPENAIKHHENIFDAIKKHDSAAAVDAMSKHLESAWDYILRAVTNPDETLGFMTFKFPEVEDED